VRVLRAVFDTNVLVSSALKRGKPRELWNSVLKGKITLAISSELLSEFDEVVSRPRLKRYLRKHRLAKFRRILLQNANVYKIKTRFSQITPDPDDNIVLETAYSAKADYLVSGDKHLLDLREFKGIKIVSVDEMLRLLRG